MITQNKVNTYRIYHYDLIPDGDKGYSVNDVILTDQYIELLSDMTDKDIIRALKKAGIINAKCHYNSFDIDGELEYTLYVNYRHNPGLELRLVDPNDNSMDEYSYIFKIK